MDVYKDGFVRGGEWASREACVDELGRLQALHVGKSFDDWSKWFVGQDAGRSAYQRVVQVLYPQATSGSVDAEAFWHGKVGESKAVFQMADFVRGFADGALDVAKTKVPHGPSAEKG
jgi:hypothetical protein